MVIMIHIFVVFLLQMFSYNTNMETFLNSLESSFEKVNDYTCKLYKKELVDGKYTLRKNINFKFKKPCYYYLNWTEGEDKGMEVIYAGKKYKNKLKVHPGGIMSFIDIAIDPRGKKALEGCRHSVLDADFGSIIELMKKNYELAQKHEGAELQQLANGVVNGKASKVFKITLPKDDIYYGHLIYLHLDEKSDLPLKFVVYDKNKKLLEDYEFWDLKVNVGLTDIDFDVDNPKYKF
ncbi:MAG: DUF1571 domain-containing protein [bacterium]